MNRLGYRNILQDGILKVMSGLTTVEEVLRVAR
jgi:type II secretory ATPase GspE/PulE/Tfp pilus assembly ATPase PilB-like protein